MTPQSLLHVHPSIQAPLDPGFLPPILGNRKYRSAVAESQQTTTMTIALERENSLVSRGDLEILAPGSMYDTETLQLIEVTEYSVWHSP